MKEESDQQIATLPDLLRPGLEVVFIGINPSLFSARQGHYFARRANRFWPCFSRSVLSRAARAAMGLARLEPIHDQALIDHGFGFTDVVKRPTARAAELANAEFVAGVTQLTAKIERCAPRIACFHGITAYRQFHRALAGGSGEPALGLQMQRLGASAVFVLPNPSPANAHFTPDEQTGWYDKLATCLAELTDRRA